MRIVWIDLYSDYGIRISGKNCIRFVPSIKMRLLRFIVVALGNIPLDSLLPVMLTHLPLKEDMDEYEMVFKVSHHPNQPPHNA